MKLIIIAITILHTSNVTYSQGIKFIKDLNWSQIQQKSKLENKPIFIDAYTTWCGPCRQMAAEVFTRQDVGDLINENFLPLKLQMDTGKNDNVYIKQWYADAKLIGKEHSVRAYPTVIILLPGGNVLKRMEGFRDDVALIAEIKDVLDKTTKYNLLLNKYKAGILDTSAMKKLVLLADNIDKITARRVAENYASYFSSDSLYKKDNLLFIGSHLNGSHDKNFNIFLMQSAKINEAVEEKNYSEGVVMKIIAREEIEPYVNSYPNWASIKSRVVKKYGKLGEERLYCNMLLYFLEKEDWVNFGKYYKLYFDRAITNERSFLHINNMSWQIVEHVIDPSVIRTAIFAMKYDILKFTGNDFGALDTYANLLYKVGKKSEAIEWQEKACKIAPDVKEIADHLKKMKAGVKIY